MFCFIYPLSLPLHNKIYKFLYALNEYDLIKSNVTFLSSIMTTGNQKMLSFTMVIHRQNFLIGHTNIHTIIFNIYVITVMVSVKN